MQRRGRGQLSFALVLIVSLFFLWGVANSLNDVLVAQFKKAFALNDLQSGLVQATFYMGYFVLALPAGFFMRRFGYKAAVVLGLCLYGVGALLFYPAAESRTYGWFLGALFVIASGLAFLETSANPLVTVLGDPTTSEQRLNFAQAFNPLGSITGVLVGRQFILSGVEHTAVERSAMSPADLAAFYLREAHAVQTPYLVLGVFVLGWAALTAVTRFPAVASRAGSAGERDDATVSKAMLGVLGRPRVRAAVIAQFFYVGAQVGVWSYTIRYAQAAIPGMGERTAASYLTAALVSFMIGRFIGTALMTRIPAARLMAVFAAINVALTLVAALRPGMAGLLALTATSVFMSIMYPTIFAIGVRGLGPLTKTGSSFLVMSIAGGAVLAAVMGRVSDLSSIHYAILVPTLCFAVVGLFALTERGAADPLRVPAARGAQY